MTRRLIPVVVVVALVGCNGGTVDRHALTKDAETLDSIACEGAVVANGVARDRTTVFFAREQAEELAIQASNLADALGKRPTVPGIRAKVREKAKDAAHVAELLWRLHDHPGDETAGASLERALKQAGSCK